MATKLGLFNAALLETGDKTLTDTGEAVEAGRVLNTVYSDVLADCLAEGPWNFAAVNYQAVGDTGLINPNTAGYTYGYAKPTDWVRTLIVSDDRYLVFPLTQYFDSQEIWATDTGEIFARYVSNDTGSGLDIANWPSAFRRYVELSLADRISYRVTQDPELRVSIGERREAAKTAALTQNGTDSSVPRYAPTASWQALYQQVLTELGDDSLLTERSGEARRAIDDVYDEAVNECLEAGSWNFAMETIKATADTGITPSFGYSKVFAKPSDFLRTQSISEDEHLSTPLLDYYDDINFWSAEYNPIYVRYVSNDTGMGLEKTRWTANFKRYVELELACRVCMRLLADGELTVNSRSAILGTLELKRDKARRRALNLDALNEVNPKFPPEGSWGQSRGGRYGGRRDRGSRSNLTG